MQNGMVSIEILKERIVNMSKRLWTESEIHKIGAKKSTQKLNKTKAKLRGLVYIGIREKKGLIGKR